MNNAEFWYDENCPCNGCPSEGACTLEKMACEDFRHYTVTGNLRNRRRTPSVDLYYQIFSEPHAQVD